ncbi:hypothetical protein FF011L_50960 [Roseimaritima multifibrata]|uniref:Uncharacterized protein n=1 Tax=Roseimaritima multifibrata TaxID=1930274 RepID=A0A517MN24_9BACT|nr:hypothetical protein [Roseimaritima multifibrata]QDS96288.1 hypothetical protein FF011L_50960 [Roseimaritima multifibrata]
MSDRQLKCPRCEKRIRVPAGAAKVRCPGCQAVLQLPPQKKSAASAGRSAAAPKAPAAKVPTGKPRAAAVPVTQLPAASAPFGQSPAAPPSFSPQGTFGKTAPAVPAKPEGSGSSKRGLWILLGGLFVGGGLMCVMFVVVLLIWMGGEENETAATDPQGGAIQAAAPVVEAEVVEETPAAAGSLGESERKRLYAMYKTAEGLTTNRVPLPKGFTRDQLDKMMSGIMASEIQKLSALFDISQDEVKDIVAEGKQKEW